MKILLVSHLYPRAARPMYGTFVRDQAAALAARGVDVRVCSPVPTLPWPLRFMKRYRELGSDAPLTDPVPTLRLVWLTMPGLFGEALIRRRSWRMLDRAMCVLFAGQRPDMIHAHNLFPDAYACASLCERLRIPLVATTHGTDNRVHLRHPYRRQAVIEAFHACSRVICVSQAVRDDLCSQGIGDRRLEVIYNGVDLGRTYCGPAVEALRGRFQGRLIILIVGHMVHFVKGFDITVKALARLVRQGSVPPAVLVMVGDGVERASLERLADKLGLRDHVAFEGARRPEETMQYMAACDIFCMPSWYEAFGVVYLEAMMHGKPIIGVQGQGISEIVVNGQTGLLVPPRDPVATAEAISLLLRDAGLRRAIGEQGREMVRAKYSWGRNAEQVRDVYARVLSSSRTPLGGDESAFR